MITQERLKELLHYDPETGVFTNRVSRGRRGRLGKPTGYHDKDGYIIIQIGGQKYRAHRLAWLYMLGEWPIEIDHKDGIPDNNSWINLREASRSENVANSNRATGESGLRGVIRDLRNPTLWRARIAFGYHREWLGPFNSPEEAHAAYLLAVEDHHGEFALHHRPTSSGAN